MTISTGPGGNVRPFVVLDVEQSHMAGLALRLVMVALLSLEAIAPSKAEESRVPGSATEMKLSFAPVVKAAAPAVVNIQTSRDVADRRQPFLNDPLLEFFFGQKAPRGQQEAQRVENSLGSGVLLRPDGIVVTNNHVIEGADQITVILADRRSYPATVLSRDERADLAFLKIDVHGETFPTLQLARSDALEVGDLVLAIGNPFGIGQTVTSGIVSATNRTAEGLERDVSFIQTDAAINPGNSGGALVDLDGQLVGINTAIFSRSGGSIGIGFAIPADLVRVRLQDAVSGSHEISRPWLGASLQSVDVGIAESLGLTRPRGVLVGKIWPGGAADDGRIRSGDVILSIDGAAVDDPASFGYRMALQPLGTKAKLMVYRRGSEESLAVDRAAAPARPEPDQTAFPDRHPLGGATVVNMSPAFNESHGLDPFENGVVVVDVQRRSRASFMNLEVGDVIVAIDATEVDTVDALEGALPRRNRPFAMTVKSGGRLYQFRVAS